jgi:hypothetical protein
MLQMLEHQLQRGMKNGVAWDVFLMPRGTQHKHGTPLHAVGGSIRLME